MSGIQTAYNSGDLEGLIAGMTPAQDLLLKMAVVRQSLYYIEQILPSEEDDEGERGCLTAARIWLADPTPENAQNATWSAAADAIDGGVRYHDYAAIFTEPAMVAGADDARQAIHFAAATIPAGGEQEARQWQLDAALAILQGREVPPLAVDQ